MKIEIRKVETLKLTMMKSDPVIWSPEEYLS
jgi:hypothetical protein